MTAAVVLRGCGCRRCGCGCCGLLALALFAVKGLLIVDLLLGDLVCKLKLHGIILFRRGVQRVLVGKQLGKDLVCLGALLAQSLFGLGKLFLGVLQGNLFVCKLGTGDLDLLGDGLELIQHPGVRRGDLVDHIHAVKQVGKAAGLEQDGPVGQLAAFFHRADAGTILLVELRLFLQGVVKLVLLFGDQKVVFLDLGALVVDLILGELDLLVDLTLALHQIHHVGFVFGHLGLKLGLLGGNAGGLVFQCLDLFLDLAGAGGKGAQHHAAQKREDQEGGDDADDHTTILEHTSASLRITHPGTSGWT